MKLTLENSVCRVEGSVEEQAWLSSLLTVETGEMSFGGGASKHSFYRVGQGFFPVGLVRKVLTADVPHGVGVEVEDERRGLQFPAEVKLVEGFDYYSFQKEAIEEILRCKQGLIQVATNGGKTVIMAGLLKTLEETGLRGILITHSQEIYGQLVGVMRSALKSVGEIRSDLLDVVDRQFVVAMAMTLLNRLGDDPDVTELFNEHQVFLADEGHHLQARTWTDLLKGSNARIKVGFSGTIPGEDTYAGWLVRAYTGDVLIDVRNRELIDAGISAKPIVHLYEVDSSELLKGLYKECMSEWMRQKKGPLFKVGGAWYNPFTRMKFFSFYNREVIKAAIIESTKRNRKIVKIVRERSDQQVLIIVERIKHGQFLLKRMEAAGVDAGFAHGSAEDRTELIERFKNHQLRVLIATQIFDEGVDISGIEVLVLAGGMKCKRALLQRIGRGLRRKKSGENIIHVIDFADFGNRYLENYTKARQKVYREEGFEVDLVLEGERDTRRPRADKP